MEYLVWVGPRDSDIQFSKCFKESICYFSEKNPNSDRKAHIYGNSYIEFIKNNKYYLPYPLSKNENYMYLRQS